MKACEVEGETGLLLVQALSPHLHPSGCFSEVHSISIMLFYSKQWGGQIILSQSLNGVGGP